MVQQLDVEMRELIGHSRKQSSNESYSAGMSKYRAYHRLLKTPFKFLTLPTTLAEKQLQIFHLGRFISFMSRDGLRSGTIGQYLNAVRQTHLRRCGVDIIADMKYLRLLISGIRNKEQEAGITVHRKMPFTWEMLMESRRFYNLEKEADLEEFTCVATGIGFLLRSSELLNDKRTNHYLRRKDIQFNYNKGYLQSVTITVRSSKTSSEPVYLSLGYNGNRTSVAALLYKYIQSTTLRPASSPLFPSLTRQQLSSRLKCLAVCLGYHGDSCMFASHSLRRGGATSLLNAGVPCDYIQFLGRWKTDCWKQLYAKLLHETQLLVTFKAFSSGPYTLPPRCNVGDISGPRSWVIGNWRFGEMNTNYTATSTRC